VDVKIEEVYENIYLIEKKSCNTASELKENFSGKKVCICDFYIEDSENGEIDESGVTNYCDLLIVDHHAPVSYMRKHISSAVIASKYVSANSPLSDEYVIVVNHTDTDSLLSALLMSGGIEPNSEYEQAAIAADHTGEENIISDLLQSLEEGRELKASIEELLSPTEDLEITKERHLLRSELKELVNNCTVQDGIAYINMNKKIDAGLLPALFPPDVKAIMVASPMPDGSKGKWRIRVRLGNSSEEIELNKLNLPDTGGRWNAISTSRHGGTNIEPEDYLKMLSDKLNQH
jgi:hypothetical protein